MKPEAILLMYSREFEVNGLPWRVETANKIYYVKHVEVGVPSFTFHRPNAAPAYVLKCYGLVQYQPESQSLKIV